MSRQIIALTLHKQFISAMKSNLFMKSLLILALFPLSLIQAQTYKFYASNNVKFLKSGSSDSLKMPFTGGMNAPQLSNIDLDGDGVQDLYIFDRTGHKSLTFLRKGNSFEHTPYYEGKFPLVTDWVQLRDFNGDGKMDIFTEVTMEKRFLPDTNQYVTISGLRILKNVSDKSLKFKQVSNQVMDTGGVQSGFPVDPANIYINYTDIAGIGDMDGDGDADVLPFVQSSLSPNYYENYIKNPHGINYTGDSTRYVWRDQCWGYMMFDRTYRTNTFELGLTKDQMASCFYQMYEKKAKHTNNSVCIMDYNGDSVADLIYGDGGFNSLLLLVNGRNKNSQHRDSIISQDTMFPSNTQRANFIIFPVAYYVDIDGDGVNELVVTTNEPISAKSRNNIWLYENTGTTAKPILQYVGNTFFAYDETIDLGTRSAPVLTDIDNDGDDDLVVATSGDYAQTAYFSDHLVLYKNIGKVNGRSVFQLADSNFLQLSNDTPLIGIAPAFADLNGDGKKDLILGDQNGYILYYMNQSSGSTYHFALQTRFLGSIDAGTNAAPTFWDLDKDGDQDMVVGTRNGFLRYYANSGSATNPQFSSTPTIDSLGKVLVNHAYTAFNNVVYRDVTGYATPYFYDLNKDGTPELIVGSYYGNVYVYNNVNLTPGATFTQLSQLFVDYSDSTNAASILFGRQSSPCVGLLDEDDKPDFFVGNIRGGLSYYSSLSDKTGNIGLPGIVERNQFEVYPNPSSGLLTIRHEGMMHDGDISLYNQTGQLVLQMKLNHFHSESTLSMEQLPSGFYVVRIQGPDYASSVKIIKN